MENSAFQQLIDSIESLGHAMVPILKSVLGIIVQGFQILINLIKEGMTKIG
ncbi:MAG: hypothetical protein PHP35_02930 [Candidatus Colwellbacteria bacterium]|nr:hypothetical protein [Candidatus Colwellbacteria bacterium]